MRQDGKPENGALAPSASEGTGLTRREFVRAGYSRAVAALLVGAAASVAGCIGYSDYSDYYDYHNYSDYYSNYYSRYYSDYYVYYSNYYNYSA